MTPELIDLGRRAVASPRWVWRPSEPEIPARWLLSHHGLVGRYRDPTAGALYRHVMPGDIWLPDLSDPATLGCLLALVREAFGDPTISASCVGGAWRIERDGHPCWLGTDGRWAIGRTFRDGAAISCPTEAAALVAALEVAP